MIKQDGFANAFLGFGTKHDPFAHFSYNVNNAISWDECDRLYTYNGIARKIIDIPAREAMTHGFKLSAGGTTFDDNAIMSILEDLNVSREITSALIADRLYGGGAIVVIADDGGELTDELDAKSMRSIDRLIIIDAPDISKTDVLYGDPTDINYGKVKTYQMRGKNGNTFAVDASRVILFDGELVSNRVRRARGGWGGKVFDTLKSSIVQYDSGLSLALMALSRLSQGILRLDNLGQMLMSDEGEEAVRKRLELIDMARSVLNTIAISTDDEYDQKNLSLAGIEDLMVQFQYSLSAISNIPATILFGRSPAGENSTGRADFENYYNIVAQIQRRKVKPALLRLIELISASSDYNISLPEQYTLEFKPLWNLSDEEKERAEASKAQALNNKAQAFNTLFTIGAIDTAEIRDTLEADGYYKLDRSLDKSLSKPYEGA